MAPAPWLILRACRAKFHSMTEDPYAIKRRSQRFITHFMVTLMMGVGKSKAECPAQVVDFSKYGLTIASCAALAPGEQVEIVPQEGHKHAVVGRVVWVREIGSGQEVRAALEFLNPIA
jgi:D-lyxose ketol-isomerase